MVDIFKNVYASILDIETNLFLYAKCDVFSMVENMSLFDLKNYSEMIIDKMEKMNKDDAQIPNLG